MNLLDKPQATAWPATDQIQTLACWGGDPAVGFGDAELGLRFAQSGADVLLNSTAPLWQLLLRQSASPLIPVLFVAAT